MTVILSYINTMLDTFDNKNGSKSHYKIMFDQWHTSLQIKQKNKTNFMICHSLRFFPSIKVFKKIDTEMKQWLKLLWTGKHQVFYMMLNKQRLPTWILFNKIIIGLKWNAIKLCWRTHYFNINIKLQQIKQ